MDGWAAWNWVAGAAMQKLSWVLNETPTDVWLWGVQPRDVFMHTNWDADGGSDNCQVAQSQGSGCLHTEPLASRKPSLLSTEPSSGVHQGSAVQNRRFPLPWAPRYSFFPINHCSAVSEAAGNIQWSWSDTIAPNNTSLNHSHNNNNNKVTKLFSKAPKNSVAHT